MSKLSVLPLRGHVSEISLLPLRGHVSELCRLRRHAADFHGGTLVGCSALCQSQVSLRDVLAPGSGADVCANSGPSPERESHIQAQ